MGSAWADVKVGLAQINNGFSGQHYLPYSVGFLQAHAEKHASDPSRYRFSLPLYKRIQRDAGVDHLASADIVGMSVYVWNFNISAAISKALKEARGDRLMVFGGPHVPDRAEAFLRQHADVDVAVHGEGERTFLALLEAYPENDWSRIPGISYLDDDGTFVHNPKMPRLRDLATIPSPYLSGTFAPLIEANPDEVWLAMWETNRGCPFSCSFCDWGSATSSKIAAFDSDDVKAELEWFADHRIEFVFCCDANFGILPRDVEIAKTAADCKARRGYPMALSVQNTKNATERAYLTQKTLADAGLSKGVTISLQSTDAHTLKAIKRQNISVESFMELQRRFARDGVATYTDFIIGLPGETVETFFNGVSDVIETGQHNRIQFNNLSILPNAEMGDPAYIAEFGLETVETDIVNMHGTLERPVDGITETQELVIATSALPRADWRRVRTFAWMSNLLHFNKMLQVPLLVLHHHSGARFRSMFEAFMDADAERYPLVAEISAFFDDEARAIQDGAPEFKFSPQWLGIYWPADEYVMIELAVNDRIDAFYDEAGQLLGELISGDDARAILDDAIRFNRALLKQPFQLNDLQIDLRYDIPAFYADAVRRVPGPIEADAVSYRVERSKEVWSDWETWMREAIWYGHRTGAYLYGTRSMERAIAGHY
jgi:radical SAM superfamily enzyme YgiQ (UPF0313 family)